MSGVPGFIGFQAAWWATALFARAHHPWLATLAMLSFVALHVALRPKGRRGAAGVLAVAAALVGVAVEGALRGGGALSYHPAVDAAPAPAFMIALWAGMAPPLETSLRWLTRRPLTAALVGAVGGALAYRGGASLGVLTVHDVSGVSGLAFVALAWAVATPLLGAVTAFLEGEAAARRARTIPRLLGLAALALLLAPIAWPLALLVDVVRWLASITAGGRRPFMSVRVLAFAYVYLAAELAGLALLVAAPSLEATWRTQERFGLLLLGAVRRLFRLRFVVDGDDVVAALPPGARPVVIVRHASIIDTLLPTVFITRPHGLRLRFVLKRELLEDPCLDIAGTRLPNHFAARSSARDGQGTADDLVALRALAAGLAADEGAVIYPEGTRFTPEKRARALARLALDAPHLVDEATALVHLLPPKPAGVGALLDGARQAGSRGDVIIVAHDGLEGFAHVADIWSGALLGRTVRVHMRHVPGEQVPVDAAARARWLYAEWQRMDAWLT